MSPSASSRWCPTPEQLMILEELYRSGVRTPNASQIQRITAHLSSYGKIEGKNVFYWFQNHKARDRQKLRKKLIKQFQQHQQQQQVQCPHDLHQQQLIIQQDQSNHRLLLNYFNPLFIPPPASSTSASHHQLPYDNRSPSYPPQVGNEGAHTATMIDHTWKVEIPPRIMEDPNMMMMRPICGHDWMMMMMMEDAGPPLSPCCNTGISPTRPLKTLELFPITATNLKEEFNPSPKHLSCLTPTN